MSTDATSGSPSPDEDAVRRAKAEIQGLVEEVYNLSRTEIEPAEFFAALLDRSISALAAIGGVVWTIEEGGPFKLEYQVNLQQTGLIGDESAQHGRLLSQLAKRDEGSLVPPNSGTGEDGDQGAANPTPFLLVAAPIRSDRGVDGMVEIFQRTGAKLNTQRGYLRFLEQMCELAGEYLKTRRLRHFTEKQSLWEQLESFTSLVHQKLDSRETAYTIANEGRRLVGCDRVTVVLRKGPKFVVEAISGQDTFDKRSNAVRLLRNLASVVVRGGEDLWYTGDTSALSPQVEKAVNEYVDEAHTKQLAVLPLREHDPHADDKTRARKSENMLGAIVIEQLVDGRAPDGMLQRVDVVRRHSATALTNSQSHEGLFLLPVWRTIGRSRVLVTARNLPKTILASIALVALGLLAWLLPWDFTMKADGKLLPEVRKNVFAAIDGTVIDVPVDEGVAVKQGDLLARLESLDLENRILQLEGEILANDEQIASAERKRRLLSGPQVRDVEAEMTELTGELLRLRTVGQSLREQRGVLEKQKSLLEVRSPIDGKVITWDAHDVLENHPVRTGQRLMEVADPTQDWQLRIEVPEARMGHIQGYWNRLRQQNPQAQLDVTFILATHPSVKLEGRVTKVHSSAEVSGDRGNTVRMDVSFNQNELVKLRPDGAPGGAEAAVAELKRNLKVGADVKAKIHCGRAPVGYVILHDAWEFIQSRILFRLY
jgi:multidrug efflux pump subunit AcrA (membrane-fusion protein)